MTIQVVKDYSVLSSSNHGLAKGKFMFGSGDLTSQNNLYNPIYSFITCL